MKLKLKKKFVIFGVKYFSWAAKLWYQITLLSTRIKHFPVQPVDSAKRIPERLEFGTGYKKDSLPLL